jgi:hypothetical protein
MHEYTFTFNDGDATILKANLIAEAMYAQCNPDGNQYVLLDSIIDHRWLDTAIRPSDQKVVRPNGRTYMNAVPLVGKCAASGRMNPHPGRTLLISRNLTLLRLLNMLWLKALTMSKPSSGWFPMSWRSLTRSYP